MALSLILALIGFAFAAVITPGPNNMMLLASGANFGFRRSLPHMSGVIFGSMVLQTAVGAGLGILITSFPPLLNALKIVGGAYLIYLAWRLATRRTIAATDATGSPMTFTQAAAFQWVNPKGWVSALAAMAAFTSEGPYAVMAVLVVLSFAAMSTISLSVWTGFGTALRQYLQRPRYLRGFNLSMATLLMLSLWPMLK
ncbi:LysE family translocator [Martelella alba]|uniref:LysE family translocator n=1 Tax=Martelella alba TaxID=2590451 RepID=A0A506UIM2_9HYPH|nr:LysE family translocator [Martelella alba]TPW33160.1 LysE family translocator [Martelella alba]